MKTHQKNVNRYLIGCTAAAVATFALGSPVFAATYGGFSNDTGNMRPSYYDNKGWHPGRAPEAQRARAAPQRQAVTQESATPGRRLYLYAANDPGLSVAQAGPGVSGSAAPGGMSNQMPNNDWFWVGSNP